MIQSDNHRFNALLKTRHPTAIAGPANGSNTRKPRITWSIGSVDRAGHAAIEHIKGDAIEAMDSLRELVSYEGTRPLGKSMFFREIGTIAEKALPPGLT